MNIGNRQSQHNFAQIPSTSIERSSFNRSFGRKQTFDADYLIPIYLDEILPGDTFNVSLTSFARLATPIVPYMDNMYMDYFFFFVPNRLVWDNWQKMNGEQDDPGDSTDYTIPQAHTNASTMTVTENTLQNYLGLPKGTFDLNFTAISALPTRCYNLIWNTWFRDENLQDRAVVDKDNGPDDPADYVIRKRGKRHDYFTSALPWPQKGTAVALPLGTVAPIYYDNTNNNSPIIRSASSHNGAGAATLNSNAGTSYLANAAAVPLVIDPNETLYTDLSEATAATINQLREAFQVQRLYERDARGGTRYIEILKSHFGVVSPDARLQRPEYLGGGSAPININPIAQTSSTDATTPQGNLAAMGTSTARGIGFQKSFVEHGYVIGLASARADLSYQQGINKLWNRNTRFDFYWPTLAHLGEQAIMNSELYAQGTTDDDAVFGYQERYAEYRYKPSEILGTFMSSVASSLDIWHLAQEFSALPVLNDSFIQSNTPVDRVIAVPSEPHFLWDGFFNQTCARPMPTYSVPGYIDHF